LSRQLDIFSWQSAITEEAWLAMAGLDWDQARFCIQQLLEKDPFCESAHMLQETQLYWHSRLSEGIKEPDLLLNEIRQFDFGSEWGNLLLKHSLLKIVIQTLRDKNLFFTAEGSSLSALLFEIGDSHSSEAEVRKQLPKLLNEPQGLWHCANVFWNLGLFAESRFYYLRTLLLLQGTQPEKVAEDAVVQGLVETHPLPYVPAISWCYGAVLPLQRLKELSDVPDSLSKRLCEAVMAAENASIETVAQARKKLHELSPDFYANYFEWKKTGKILLGQRPVSKNEALASL
jgi:hypothetical protein